MTISEFLAKSYTCYHAAANGAEMLARAGFADIDSDKTSKKGYYRVSGGSLMAARIGGGKLNLVLSHTDSPSLRIRCDGKTTEPTLETEKYGGGLLRSYLDRKMKIAGRMIVKEGGALISKLVCSDYNVVIPSLAVHLGAGKEGESLTVSRDMRPMLGDCESLYASLGCGEGVDADLYCVPAEEAYASGANGEFICSPRIDNLASVYASVRALSDCENKSAAVIACFNSEETGSETREGACAKLLRSFTEDFARKTDTKTNADKLLECAFALSCDGAHGMHPNHKEVYSPSAPVLGGGVVIKRNDRYATDALTAAVAREIFDSAGVKVQVYRHHPDMRCGSTIGLTAAHTLGCHVCDIGVPQLAMHSAVETAAFADIDALERGLKAFFEKVVTVREDRIEIG